MIVILRPPGRGNWAPVRLDLLMPGKHGPLPLEVLVGQRWVLDGKVFRVSKVMP